MPRAPMTERLLQGLLIAAGTFFLGLGVIGIFLPLLPTTPFLLLAVACYAKGSKRFYASLLSNRWLGSYIRGYREGKGIPLRTKAFTILLLWVTIGYSAVFVVPFLVGKLILAVTGMAVTWHVVSIKTTRE